MKTSITICLTLLLAGGLIPSVPASHTPRHIDDHAGLCTYNTYKWNTRLKKAVEITRVEKPYDHVANHEVDPDTGCSICEQDQQQVQLPGIKPFKVCYRLAEDIKRRLKHLINQGVYIKYVDAYRPGMTRGEPDAQGNRTRFSNHSFGVALDINPSLNGLYSNCPQFNAGCKLIRGGPWRPGIPGTLDTDHPVVKALKDMGLRWGGEIAGRQKDFMHFSPTGY